MQICANSLMPTTDRIDIDLNGCHYNRHTIGISFFPSVPSLPSLVLNKVKIE